MQEFDIAKYLREHQLGSYAILNPYLDLKPLKEEEDETELDTVIPYEGPEHQLTGLGDGDEFEQEETIPEGEVEEGFGDEWDPANPQDMSHKFIGAKEDTEVLSKAIEALANAGLTLDQIKAFASTVENNPEALEQALAFE